MATSLLEQIRAGIHIDPTQTLRGADFERKVQSLAGIRAGRGVDPAAEARGRTIRSSLLGQEEAARRASLTALDPRVTGALKTGLTGRDIGALGLTAAQEKSLQSFVSQEKSRLLGQDVFADRPEGFRRGQERAAVTFSEQFPEIAQQIKTGLEKSAQNIVSGERARNLDLARQIAGTIRFTGTRPTIETSRRTRTQSIANALNRGDFQDIFGMLGGEGISRDIANIQSKGALGGFERAEVQRLQQSQDLGQLFATNPQAAIEQLQQGGIRSFAEFQQQATEEGARGRAVRRAVSARKPKRFVNGTPVFDDGARRRAEDVVRGFTAPQFQQAVTDSRGILRGGKRSSFDRAVNTIRSTRDVPTGQTQPFTKAPSSGIIPSRSTVRTSERRRFLGNDNLFKAF